MEAQTVDTTEALKTLQSCDCSCYLQNANKQLYVLDVLKIIKKENTIIKLNDPLNPAIITPEEDKNYVYVLMPVRTD